MKGVYVIAIAFLASWAVSAINLDQDQLAQSVLNEDEDAYQDGIPIICPYPEKNASNLPHEYDCTKFYKCDVGKGILQDCPLMNKGDPVTRLHYNRFLQVCDWPWQAGCETCPPRNADGTYPPQSKIKHESDNCNLYYECINGVKYLRSCGNGQCFSRTCQQCVWNRAGGNCGGWETTPTSPTPTDCNNPPAVNGDLRSHDCNCAKYYVCYKPDWTTSLCPDGLHFSPTQRKCLPPNIAGCLLPNK